MSDSMKLSCLDIDISSHIPYKVERHSKYRDQQHEEDENKTRNNATESDNVPKTDIEDSLHDSYVQMKTKLDELEEYNKTLELQLGNIFKSIGAAVKTPNMQNDNLEKHDKPKLDGYKHQKSQSKNTQPIPENNPNKVVSKELLPIPDKVPEGEEKKKTSISQMDKHCHDPVKSSDESNKKCPKISSSKNEDLSNIIRDDGENFAKWIFNN